jgi:uncharacterized protein
MMPLAQVKKWVEEVIVALNICPFAKTPLEEKLIRFSETESTEFEDQLQFFIDELKYLSDTPTSEISTSLIIFSKNADTFESFLDFTSTCEQVLTDLKLTELYQLVAFHPSFLFEGIDKNKRDHLVNRSPVPLIHLIRSDELAAVITHPSMGEEISHANSKKLEELDIQIINKLFKGGV